MKRGKNKMPKKVEAMKNLSIPALGRIMGIAHQTIRSHVRRNRLGHQDEKGNITLSGEDIKQIQEYYKSSDRKKYKSSKISLSDLVSKSQFLVYVPGVRQLSGFSDIKEIKEFVQNSLLTGQIVIFKKVPAKIDVSLQIE